MGFVSRTVETPSLLVSAKFMFLFCANVPKTFCNVLCLKKKILSTHNVAGYHMTAL